MKLSERLEKPHVDGYIVRPAQSAYLEELFNEFSKLQEQANQALARFRKAMHFVADDLGVPSEYSLSMDFKQFVPIVDAPKMTTANVGVN